MTRNTSITQCHREQEPQNTNNHKIKGKHPTLMIAKLERTLNTA